MGADGKNRNGILHEETEVTVEWHRKELSVESGNAGAQEKTALLHHLTAQPSLANRQIERKQMKLAMFVGDNRHYRLDEIKGRHFVQTSERADFIT